MISPIKIAPSLLSADFAMLRDEIEMVCEAGADILHLDVMDGHFVPNITIGPCVVEAVRKVSSVPLDVHLMISDPEKYLDSFVKAGSDWITFHIEALSEPQKFIERAKSLGVKVGVSLKPQTTVAAIEKILPLVDLVLVMSVEPGFGGQSFRPEVLAKVQELRSAASCPPDIGMDGGLNLDTVPQVVKSGVNVLVAGSAIFHAQDPEAMVGKLREVALKEVVSL
jgi:ribulose-phosphate 3-epimerase